MALDPNDIDLNDEDRQLLFDAERMTGTPWRTILHDFLRQTNLQDPASSVVAESQKNAQKKLFESLDALPVRNPDDGVCASREHDRILYGRK